MQCMSYTRCQYRLCLGDGWQRSSLSPLIKRTLLISATTGWLLLTGPQFPFPVQLPVDAFDGNAMHVLYTLSMSPLPCQGRWLAEIESVTVNKLKTVHLCDRGVALTDLSTLGEGGGEGGVSTRLPGCSHTHPKSEGNRSGIGGRHVYIKMFDFFSVPFFIFYVYFLHTRIECILSGSVGMYIASSVHAPDFFPFVWTFKPYKKR